MYQLMSIYIPHIYYRVYFCLVLKLLHRIGEKEAYKKGMRYTIKKITEKGWIGSVSIQKKRKK